MVGGGDTHSGGSGQNGCGGVGSQRCRDNCSADTLQRAGCKDGGNVVQIIDGLAPGVDCQSQDQNSQDVHGNSHQALGKNGYRLYISKKKRRKDWP